MNRNGLTGVSYLTQVTLSNRLRFKGLYQAQVFSRGDSPAHHADHLRIALRILSDRKVDLPTMSVASTSSRS